MGATLDKDKSDQETEDDEESPLMRIAPAEDGGDGKMIHAWFDASVFHSFLDQLQRRGKLKVTLGKKHLRKMADRIKTVFNEVAADAHLQIIEASSGELV